VSTKVYNGFRFVPRSLLRVHEALMALREDLRLAQVEAAARWIAREAADRCDRRALGEADDGTAPAHAALLSLWERQRKVQDTQLRDPAVDWDVSLAVLPFRGRVYGIAYIESPAIRKVVTEKDWFEDYSWSDATDRPDAIPEPEWMKRGELWNALLDQDGLGRPSGCGFGFDAASPAEAPERKDVMRLLPSFEARVASHAKSSALGARLSAAGAQVEWSAVMKAIAWLVTDEGKAAIEAEKSRIAGVLSPVLTDVDLYGADA